MSTLSAVGTTETSPAVVWAAPGTYLVTEGEGEPGTPHWRHALAAIHAVAHTLALQMDLESQIYRPGPVEALWWPPEGETFESLPGLGWRWKLLLRVPDDVDAHLVRLIKDSLVARRHLDDAADVRIEEIDEGACVEAVHRGLYGTEGDTLCRMHAFMVESHLQPAGPRHEVYLSALRGADPLRAETLIRQPVR